MIDTKKIFEIISRMSFWNKALRLLLILFAVSFLNAKAQRVTFKVNLAPQLKDSVYVPGRDRIYLKGDVYPLSNSEKIYLQDVAPTDSIFEATVNFPSTARGKRLQYSYVIATPDEELTEHMPRVLQLGPGDQELDALYFDSFAW